MLTFFYSIWKRENIQVLVSKNIEQFMYCITPLIRSALTHYLLHKAGAETGPEVPFTNHADNKQRLFTFLAEKIESSEFPLTRK